MNQTQKQEYGEKEIRTLESPQHAVSGGGKEQELWEAEGGFLNQT